MYDVLLAAEKHSQKTTHLGERLLWVLVLVALVAAVYWLMWRAWRKRAARQSDLPELPAIPERTGPPLAELTGRYLGSTTAGDWLDRIAARGLGTRSLAEVELSEAGLAVHRPGAADFFVPAAALRGARLDKGIAGKVVPEGGLLVVTWQHGDRTIDSGFRSEHPADHPAWVEAIENLNTAREGAR
ncbi:MULTISPECIES: PH-like domain-containing protein [Streptomycetaceae]|nr:MULTISPECIES: hypothetical protein [Streptomycetaceae]MYS62132.1 hypothetical protein [Streptomyces sp. SID5468]CCB78027.1 putative integral membrane protein [Streptantibioticus cattleyicolor NRRL 8057 = DSM 46488]